VPADPRAASGGPSPRAPDGPAPSRLARALLVALAVLPYLNALRAGFVYDDIFLYRKHPAVQGELGALAPLTSPYWAGLESTALWRPLTTLSFAVDHALVGNAPAWPHAVNVALHAAVTLLGFALVRRLGRPGSVATERVAFVSAALFAVHPLHTEAVTWVAGRAELWAAAGLLLALHAALRGGARAGAGAFAFTFLGVCGKESAAAAPFAMAWLRFADPRGLARPGAAPIAASLAAVLLYAALRFAVLGTWGGPQPRSLENPLVGTTLLERLPTVFEGGARYVALLAWPRALSIDYGFPVLDVVRSWTPAALAGLALAVGLAALAVLRRRAPEGWGTGLALLGFGVASNLFVVIGTIFAERLFYLPSLGLLVAVAALGARLAATGPAARRALSLVLVAALLLGGARTWLRNRDYRDGLTIAESALAVHPRSAKMQYNLAVALAGRGRHEEAIAAARRSQALAPSTRWNHAVIADSLVALGRVDEAETLLRTDLEADPGNDVARTRLLDLLLEQERDGEANRVAEAGLDASPEPERWVERAALAAQQRGELALATRRWLRAVALLPDAAPAWSALGSALYATGRAAPARRAFERALDLDAQDPRAANGLAWLLLEAGEQHERALALAERAVEGEPDGAHWDTLARARERSGDCAGARAAAAEAARLEPAYAGRLASLEQRCAAPP